MRKYTMIVTEEDDRYTFCEKGLCYYADHPWEGNLSSIVFGDTAEELMGNGSNEGLFYQLYETSSGNRVGTGIVNIDLLVDDISEYEKKISYRGNVTAYLGIWFEDQTVAAATFSCDFTDPEKIKSGMEAFRICAMDTYGSYTGKKIEKAEYVDQEQYEKMSREDIFIKTEQGQ